MNDVTLYCGDCAQVMAEHIADNSIDLTVTSPPYDNLRTYNGYTFDFEAIAAQLWRVTKPGGVVVWVVGDATINGSETGTSFRQALRFMELGFNLHDTMIYEKPGSGLPHDDGRYGGAWEYMFVLSKGRPLVTNLRRFPETDKIAKTTRRNADGSIKAGTYKAGGGVLQNIWRYKGETKQPHPAPFPEALARDHILSWSNPGDVVLDPMMGSGTTGKMALLTGRRFVGIDISAEYVELARQRIAKVQAQPFLFHPAETQEQPEQLTLE